MRRLASLAPFVFAFVLPCAALAAGFVHTNTADSATLQPLPHIGAATANKIITYRTQNGPFASIEGLQKVSGIGSGSNYADIAPLITVGDAANDPNAGNNAASSTDSSANSASASSGGSSTYVPPPRAISAVLSGKDSVLANVPARFSARIETESGAVDRSAQVLWSFGDGSSGEGVEVSKTYHFPGTYVVCATALDGSARVEAELTVTVTLAKVSVAAVTDDGVLLANDADAETDLSGWRLVTDAGPFRIPVGTRILAGAQVLFPWTIMNLPIAFDAWLTYPEGRFAAAYAKEETKEASTTAVLAPESRTETATAETASFMQLHTLPASSQSVQEVEPVISEVVGETPHDIQESQAPATTTNGVAAGAAQTAAVGAADAAPTGGLVRSPWFIGFLGLVLASGSALILL